MASDKVKTFTDGDFGESVKNGPRAGGFLGRVVRARAGAWRRPVDQLAEEYNGRLTVAKMNIDENPMTPPNFMIRGIPTLLLFKDGDLKETRGRTGRQGRTGPDDRQAPLTRFARQ